MSDTEEQEELTLDEFRNVVIRCFNGQLEAWRRWLLECFLTGDNIAFRGRLQDRDLTSTFGAMVFVLSEADKVGEAMVVMISDQELMSRARRNLRRSFSLEWRWDPRPELNPDHRLILGLRQRFKGLRFIDFLRVLLSALPEEDSGFSAVIVRVSDFCELVYLLRRLGRLEAFKLWLESFRGTRPDRPEVWTRYIRRQARGLETPEGRNTLC